jgi:hypothetical protein
MDNTAATRMAGNRDPEKWRLLDLVNMGNLLEDSGNGRCCENYLQVGNEVSGRR